MTTPRIVRREALVEDKLPGDWPEPLRRVLVNRGVGCLEEAETPLKELLPYHDLKGIDAAVALLEQALGEQWRILFVGDYDSDGATATALGVGVLKAWGAAWVDFIVPDRFEYGYGLSPAIVELAKAQSPDLIITVDNGIASIEGVAAAQQAGIRVLVTDHHLAGEQLPNADAIVNPNQPGCRFPSKKLAGVGVIFYVLAALRARLRETGQLPEAAPALVDWLDLVALGTVADVVPLDYNNRILVSQGLKRIRAGRSRPGIVELALAAKRDITGLTATDMAFGLAPRLNAAGRLDDMSIGIRCLLTTDPGEAQQLAAELHSLNQQRREIQDDMQTAARSAVQTLQLAGEASGMPTALCVHGSDWHEGVVGLVAGHLKEKFHRPSVAFANAGEAGWLKGSARSIPGFHIRDALDAVATSSPGLIEKFGGHAMAAGLSLREENLDAFIKGFEGIARSWLSDEQLESRLATDGELKPQDISLALAESLEQAGPWGQHFEEPSFDGRFVVTEGRVVGEKHLKLKLTTDKGHLPIDAIAFNCEHLDITEGAIEAVYRLSINEWRGNRSAQLIIEHLQPI